MDLEEIVVHPRTPQQEPGLAVLRDAIFERQLLSERRRLSVGDAVRIRFDSDACIGHGSYTSWVRTDLAL